MTTREHDPWLPAKGKRIILEKEEHPFPEVKREMRQPVHDLLNNGIINLDKPSGPTSHQVVSWVRDTLEISKSGHSGTLDPSVSGVLPVALGLATKLLKVLLLGGKEYVGILELKKRVPEETLMETFREFTGEIYQIPPLQAAVKRQLRIRNVYSLELLELHGMSALFRTNVESGTYIRTLCQDMGHRLGTQGRMADLRRTRSGQFLERDSITLQELKDAFTIFREDGDEDLIRKAILPVERMVDHLPEIMIKLGAVDAICHGAPLARAGALEIHDGIKRGDLLAMKTSENELVAVAKASMNAQEIVEAERGIVAKPIRVIMEPDSYPRMWKQRM